MKRFSSRAANSPPAEKVSKVVMLDGTLREFSRGVTANHAANGEADCIIFDTERLHIGEYISQMEPEAELEPGHIYMLLPHESMLNHRLDSEDMEKLAVKVKEALVMAAVEKKFERSTSFCGLREIFPGKEIGGRLVWREERESKEAGSMSKIEGRGKRNKVEGGEERKINKKGEGEGKKERKINKKVEGGKENMNKIEGEGKKERKKGERKESKCRYVWYLGFASFPIEEEN